MYEFPKPISKNIVVINDYTQSNKFPSKQICWDYIYLTL